MTQPTTPDLIAIAITTAFVIVAAMIACTYALLNISTPSVLACLRGRSKGTG